MENQRVKMTKRLLKESLISLLEEQNINKISIRELCQRAEVNRSTFYKYYGSQFDLLREMEEDLIKAIEKILLKNETNTAEEALENLRILCEYLEKNEKLARLLINNNIDPDFPNKLFSLPIIENSLKNEMKKSYLKKDHDYVFSFVIAGCFEMAKVWINKEKHESAAEFSKLLMDVMIKIV